MTVQENIFKKQKKLIVKINPKLAEKLQPEARKMLANSYMQLFAGYSWLNWTDKKPLGQAWQTAFGQCENVLKSQDASNPSVEYLKAFAAAHKKHQSENIMTNKNSPNMINKSDAEIEKIRKSANKMIQQAQDKIKLIIAQTMQHEEQVADNSKQAPQARPEILNAHKNLQQNAAQLSQAKPEINQSNSDFEKLAKMTDKNKMQDLPKSDEFQENKNSADKTQGKAQLELVDKNKDQQKQQQPNINAQDFINKQREIAQKDKMAHDNVKIRMQIFAMQFYNNQMRAA